jgi:short-subunit dehydrogenase
MTILNDQRVILTGSSGGIGSALTAQLLQQGCKVGMVGRSMDKLGKVASADRTDDNAVLIEADINLTQDRQFIIDTMQEKFNGYDMLINTAGIMDFTAFKDQTDERVEAVFETNVIAPMLLCKKVLPQMLAQNKGHIVNIGSVFGTIGFAWFTTYSSSKFALRGFSEALRRELADTSIKVSYIAPRAVKTSLNSSAVYDMAKEVKMNMDNPELVAKQIIRAIIKNSKNKYIGFPESLFSRINAILPGIVDSATRSQNKIAQKYL